MTLNALTKQKNNLIGGSADLAGSNNTKTKNDESPRLFEWLPFTINQRDNLIKLSIKASWFGSGGLIILWIVVRFIGPAAGWWTLADSL